MCPTRAHEMRHGGPPQCATGVYHAAANTLSSAILSQIGERGGSVEEYLCQHQNVWGPTDRYFDRCAAGLGMIDGEQRLFTAHTWGAGNPLADQASRGKVHELHALARGRIGPVALERCAMGRGCPASPKSRHQNLTMAW